MSENLRSKVEKLIDEVDAALDYIDDMKLEQASIQVRSSLLDTELDEDVIQALCNEVALYLDYHDDQDMERALDDVEDILNDTHSPALAG